MANNDIDMVKKKYFPVKIWIRYLFLILVAISFFSCAKRIAGGIVTWENRTLHQDIDAYFPDLHKAVQTALKELELPFKEEKKGRKISKITSQFDDGHQIWIEIRVLKVYRIEGTKHDLRPESETAPKYLSGITIRIEHVRDKPNAFKLLKAIHQYL